MTNEQTAHLVADIIQTWPTGPRGRIWTKAIGDLEHVTALGVYEHLRDHDEKPPTIARFIQVYHSVTPDYGWQTPADTGPAISLDDYLALHPDDTALASTRARHPSSQRPTPHAPYARSLTD